MLKTKNIEEVYDMDVFTDSGDFFGIVEECILSSNRISGWRVKSTKNSYLSRVLGGAKGVIIPHNLVKSIGDIMLISRAAIPSSPEEATAEE